MWLLVYSPRKFAWILTSICAVAVFDIFYMNHAVEVSSFIDQSKLGFHQTSFDHHYVLLWNEDDEQYHFLENFQCNACHTCIFKTRKDIGYHIIKQIDTSLFDAVVFNTDILNSTDRPTEHVDDQFFIFWSLAPTNNLPSCRINNDNFFNWTFTYRLDSPLVWNQFFVRNKTSEEIVAPNISVTWKINNDHVKPRVERILNKKTKALAWIITDCDSENQSASYMNDLEGHMNYLGVFVDVFSNCTQIQNMHHFLPGISNINKIIEPYRFLIVSEDYTTRDYVSDKILLAYNNYAVPIVYGAANYSWYLPPDSYIHTKKIDPYSLACTIKQAVDDPVFYESFFLWTNLYEVGAYPPESNPLCKLCDALVREKTEPKRRTIANFSQWWYSPEDMESCKKLNHTD